MTKFACIGSRNTPPRHLELMRQLGRLIAQNDNTVVSGNCKGADQAFQSGANYVNAEKVTLYLPWASYEKTFQRGGNKIELQVTDEAKQLAWEHHPAYDNLRPAAKSFMDRNASIIVNSQYVFAYLNHNAAGQGGTGHGWRVAEALDLPRCDLSLIDLEGKGLKTAAENLYKEALGAI